MIQVIEAELITGRSPLNTNLPEGNIWELTLACGCTLYRRVYYKAQPRKGQTYGWYFRRQPEDALPAPKFVKHSCGKTPH